MENFKADITPTKFLDKIMGLDDGPLLMVLDLFGGRESVIDILLKYFEERPDELGDTNILNSFDQILFRCSGNETYIQDWDLLWDKLENLPIGILIHLLESNPPGKRNQNCSDVALNYYMWKKYSSNTITKEIYLELKDVFDGEPEEFKKFRKQEQFKIKILEFNDLEWIKENYSEFSFDRDEILNLLKQVIINNRLDNLIKFDLFIDVVKFFAPYNTINKRYRDAFILEVFESIGGIEILDEELVDEKYKLLVENFPEIDFEIDNSKDIKDNIDIVCKEEADHITKQLQNNPNYRHD